MAYQVKIPVFEGPLDLLLHLIENNEMDIYNIPIAVITEQYLEYLARAEEIDLELTSEFLLMACTLLSIKARMLLPKKTLSTDEEELELDPRQELIAKLIEYKQYKEHAIVLKKLEEDQTKIYWRECDEIKVLKEISSPVLSMEPLCLDVLLKAYSQVITNLEKKSRIVLIAREKLTVQEKIIQLTKKLVSHPAGVSFMELFPPKVCKEEIIITFLALLEMSRQGSIYIRQRQLFADILIFLKEHEGGQTDVHSIS